MALIRKAYRLDDKIYNVEHFYTGKPITLQIVTNYWDGSPAVHDGYVYFEITDQTLWSSAEVSAGVPVYAKAIYTEPLDATWFGYKEDGVAATNYSAYQDFLDYIAENNVGHAKMLGELTASGSTGLSLISPLTKNIIMELIINLGATSPYTVFTLEDAHSLTMLGTMEIRGPIDVTWAPRYKTGNGSAIGVLIKECSYLELGNFKCNGLYQDAVRIMNEAGVNTHHIKIETIVGTGIGTGGGNLGPETSTVTAVAQTGAQGDIAQRTEIEVDDIINDQTPFYRFLAIDSQLYTIASFSGTLNDTLHIFPANSNIVITDTVEHIFGSVLHVGAGVGEEIKVDSVTAIASGIGVSIRNSSGATIQSLQASNVGLNIVSGEDLTTPHAGSYIGSISAADLSYHYLEVSTEDAGDVGSTYIGPILGQDDDLFAKTQRLRVEDSAQGEEFSKPIKDIILFGQGKIFGNREVAYNYLERNAASIDIPLSPSIYDNSITYSLNTMTFNMIADENNHRVTGSNHFTLNIIGTGTNQEPTGNITLSSQASNYAMYCVQATPTDNSADTSVDLVLNDFDGPVSMMIKTNYDTKTIEVGLISGKDYDIAFPDADILAPRVTNTL